MRRVVRTHTPTLIISLDPDKTRTALARAELESRAKSAPYILRELIGGGSSATPVDHGDVLGALAYLRAQLAHTPARDVLVLVESQPPDSPHSASVEELRRVRYHWDAACVLEGVRCEYVAPVAWESSVEPDGRGAGSRKRGAKRDATKLLGRKVNQDQADALIMLRWKARKLGRELVVS